MTLSKSRIPHQIRMALRDLIGNAIRIRDREISDVAPNDQDSLIWDADSELWTPAPGGDVLPGHHAGLQDDFAVLDGAWNVVLGAVAVENGKLMATSMEPARLFDWTRYADTGFESDNHRWTAQQHCTTTLVAEERTGGDGSQCLEIEVTAQETVQYAHAYLGAQYKHITFLARGWLRRVASDGRAVRLGVGEWGSHPNSGNDGFSDPVTSTEWTYVTCEHRHATGVYPRVALLFDDNSPVGTAARIDDVHMQVKAAVAVREDWLSDDVVLVVGFDSLGAAETPAGVVLRYEDAENYVAVVLFPNGAGTEFGIRQVIDGDVNTYVSQSAITVSSTGVDYVRCRLSGDSLHVDWMADGETEWVEDAVAASLVMTHSSRHGVMLLDTGVAVIDSVAYSDPGPGFPGDVFQQTVHVTGVTSRNLLHRCALPYLPCALVHASLVQTNVGAGRVKLGFNLDDDRYLSLATMGVSSVPVEMEAFRGDFRYPYVIPIIYPGQVFYLTLDYDGASGTPAEDPSIVLTFKRIR